jgi:hypothetical protein
MASGTSKELLLEDDDALWGRLPKSQVFLQKNEERIDIQIGSEYFTSYVYGGSLARPYLGPVIGQWGDSITRLDFRTKEHRHHTSVWISHGDVNGVDTWNEADGAHGWEKHQGFETILSGPVFGRFASRNLWTSFEGHPLLDDYVETTIYNTPSDLRIVDIYLRLTSSHGQVVLGPTKEAGPLGIRVAETMKGTAGGCLVNAYGAVGEAECWGKKAPWCDYYGAVGNHTAGVAAFDHPDNRNYPSHWHIRDYGLMALNNFYWAGPIVLAQDESIDFRYRLVFHSGDTIKAKISDRFNDYINIPQIRLLEAN